MFISWQSITDKSCLSGIICFTPTLRTNPYFITHLRVLQTGRKLQTKTAANQKPRRPAWIRSVKHRHRTVSLGVTLTGPSLHAPAWRTLVVGPTHSALMRRMGLCSSTTQRDKPDLPIHPVTPTTTHSPFSPATWSQGPITNSEQVRNCTSR